jgi:hypothetical protein
VNTLRRAIIVTVLFLPMAVSAQELTLGVDAEGAYDTNVFAVHTDEVDDGSIRVIPHAALEDHEGELRWKLRYRPYYDYYADTHEARGWSHLAVGKLSWQVNPSTRVEVSDRFGYFRSVNQFNEVVTLGEADEVVDVTQVAFGPNRNTRNTVEAGLTHKLTPTQMLVFEMGHNLIDYSREETADRQTLFAMGRYEQTISRRNTLGGGVSFRRSSLDSTPNRRSQSTDFYNLFGSWRHRFDETLELAVAAGPTWVRSDDQDNVVTVLNNQFLYPLVKAQGESRLVRAGSCPTEDGVLFLSSGCSAHSGDLTAVEESVLRSSLTNLRLSGSVPSGSDDALTFFANVTLSKRWEQWTGSISYRRQQSDSTGVGTSTVADIVTGVLDWKPSPRWNATLRVAYTIQSQANESVQSVIAVRPVDVTPVSRTFFGAAQSFALRAIEVDQDVDIDTLWVRLGVRYRVTERTTLYSNAIYWDQSSDVDSSWRDYERFRVSVGVEYRFEPIRL